MADVEKLRNLTSGVQLNLYFIVWYDTMKMISSARIHGRTNKDLVP